MRTALIPPRGLENYALHSRFHLALAIPYLMERRTYGDMYKRAVSLGDYVVLDNGAAEGLPAKPEKIEHWSNYIKASETVLPDVMYEHRQTIMAVKSFLDAFKFNGPKMAVAQGKTLGSVRTCIKAFADIPQITALGIPRHLISTLERKAVRIDLANWMQSTFPNRFQIHLLGTDPSWLTEIKKVSTYAPFVRSVDSSLPFNYAIAGKRLDSSKEVVKRPDGYFDLNWRSRVHVQLVRDNIDTFMEWTNDVSRTEESSSELRSVPAIRG